MDQRAHLNALHFDIILEQLKEHALSESAKEALAELMPYQNESIARVRMLETTSARALLETCGTPPLAAMDNVRQHLHHAQMGGMLLPSQLCEVARFVSACKRMAEYLKRGEGCGPTCAHIGVYGRGFMELSELRSEIEAAVSEEMVYDNASPALRDIRRRLAQQHAQIKEKLEHILKTKKAYLADSYISIRGDHYVLPVLRRYKNEFGGTVIETSSKGSTLFIEPTAIRSLQEQLNLLSLEEDNEVRKILYTLSGAVADAAHAIQTNMQLMEQLDILFAKGKYSAALNARKAEISGGKTLRIVQGRHPLLDAETCVPLDVTLEEGCDGMIITGPNTGGKTISIKTVGLLSAMAQSGLHIPCGEGSLIPMHDRYLCDIGDSQSISQNLSTFSGHITNVLDILKTASRDSLVLLDELGSGTDPAEGMGIAIAVLEELWLRGCMYMVTTHDPKVKDYAASTPRILAARMAFDKESLRPLYRLEMGKTGDSCALYIAQKLGMPEELLSRAQAIVYGGGQWQAPDRQTPAFLRPGSSLVRQKLEDGSDESKKRFSMGDSVIVLPDGEQGIVFRPEDDMGMMIVQVKGEKRTVNHKRVKLRIPASELYPPDYDFSIIFDSVANRKAAHVLGKRYDAEATIVYTEGNSKEE
ncbi:MAG: DNA mismatch repair protein MutS [Clostridiales bacterium]|nr:DNA mismatch repair protein MutS [Clostridiales bacterium]